MESAKTKVTEIQAPYESINETDTFSSLTIRSYFHKAVHFVYFSKPKTLYFYDKLLGFLIFESPELLDTKSSNY